MALSYPPRRGEVFRCEYPKDMKAPEMIKTRLVLVVSPKLRCRKGLCTVVPFSTTDPILPQDYQCQVKLPIDPPGYPGQVKWVKADMIDTFSYERLSLLQDKKRGPDGKRKYCQIRIDEDDMERVLQAVQHALGLL
ncbi:type II toxin-antitoxin system PemK/MazF family toxin [Oecophyllibacter saccharovorans]|uniref:type II toxin-antitoxin system PemK/MazF family toxin n=1 Tax=Oecophyllibacter saccharovorans TaxID=2558360 RepID=UPI00114147D1|nr:type II toxin-antitoxin system PemK/MazF family toxin [Oecophyllibacter saccharovorans]QDH15586.1 type II toxin-antitoxin system PemK/MazF family toxin [Oecophyllibacter saccharovorans]